jgi:prepilin-type N-terminal cleavage/methylation domain-containing protein/prepilin-type processing-associated H-X9-DG protein
MRRGKGFTLVELLTVISIIALLLGIMLPALNGIRRRARATVCMSNLRQWGMVYKMYTDEFDGKLPRDYGEFPWYYPIRNYYSDERKVLLCPSAKKTFSRQETSRFSQYGGISNAWSFFSPLEEKAASNGFGSYGLNGWAYKPAKENMLVDINDTDIDNGSGGGGGGGGGITANASWLLEYWRKRFGIEENFGSGNSSSQSGTGGDTDANSVDDFNGISNTERYWLMAYQDHANNIPLVFDCSWQYSYFDDNAAPPSSDGFSTRYSGRSNTTCFNRHDGGINMVFMDFSTRKVGLKELWTLKWHKQFNTNGPWTQAGGVLPENWPKWMRKYKDY